MCLSTIRARHRGRHSPVAVGLAHERKAALSAVDPARKDANSVAGQTNVRCAGCGSCAGVAFCVVVGVAADLICARAAGGALGLRLGVRCGDYECHLRHECQKNRACQHRQQLVDRHCPGPRIAPCGMQVSGGACPVQEAERAPCARAKAARTPATGMRKGDALCIGQARLECASILKIRKFFQI